MDKTRKEVIDSAILEMVKFERRTVYDKINDLIYKKINQYEKILQSKESRFILESVSGERFRKIYEIRNHLWVKIHLLYMLSGEIFDMYREERINDK